DSEVRRCVQIQEKLLEAAAHMSGDRARILYSTCTYTRNENEDRVEKFLGDNPEWRLARTQRRWPHKDGVAGGYWALLEKGEGPFAKRDEADLGEDGFEAKHVVRNGLRTWDGQTDAYALAMSRSAKRGDRAVFQIEDEARLKAFLRGEALVLPNDARPSEECDVYWGDRCVGIGKRVPGRLNNSLPKTLKSS
ncbi:MAG: hypothetical protein ABIR96_05265, partial [Bdellovibrionota bacterium]